MNWIYLGDLVNTHGLKGEVRIISEFSYKQLVFQKGVKLYLGDQKEEVTIESYRPHKMYDMVTLEGKQTIEEVLPYKGDKVYINRDDFMFPGYVMEDLIGLKVYTNEYKGIITQILKSKAHELLVIEKDERHYLVPYVEPFIETIDLENQKMIITDMKGLFDED